MRTPTKKGDYGKAWLRRSRAVSQTSILASWYVKYRGMDLGAHGWYAINIISLKGNDSYKTSPKAKYEVQVVQIKEPNIDGAGWELANDHIFAAQFQADTDLAATAVSSALVVLLIDSGVNPRKHKSIQAFVENLLRSVSNRQMARRVGGFTA